MECDMAMCNVSTNGSNCREKWSEKLNAFGDYVLHIPPHKSLVNGGFELEDMVANCQIMF